MHGSEPSTHIYFVRSKQITSFFETQIGSVEKLASGQVTLTSVCCDYSCTDAHKVWKHHIHRVHEWQRLASHPTSANPIVNDNHETDKETLSSPDISNPQGKNCLHWSWDYGLFPSCAHRPSSTSLQAFNNLRRKAWKVPRFQVVTNITVPEHLF